MLTDAVVENNKASWLHVLRFVDKFPDDETWREWKAFMHDVIEVGIETGLDRYYRAGQSMQHIIFSTCERHGLEDFSPAPPRVTLGRRKSGGMFVALSHNNLWFHDPEREDAVTSDNVESILRCYLADLWCETRPVDPVPFDPRG
jgi:hypothetical protein